ncbi:MAG: L,D-transpeptidase family protein [Hyphomicrobiaceae bacterium]
MSRLLAVPALVLAASTSFTVLAPQYIDDATIGLERLKRHLMWRAGYRLSGTPEFAELRARLADQSLKLGAPIFMRVFKREFKLELWMKRDGRFHLFQTYPICKWSGRLGPKLKEGDHQSPEGFYTVARSAMNPASRWHRSFNLGFPNVYDRQHGRTGSYLMVHGGCSSVGCYAVTNAAVDEIWRIAKAAFRGGQRRFHVHAYPFRMTNANLAPYRGNKWIDFWNDLKSGHDAFEATGLPPRIYSCRSRYITASADNGRSSGAYRIVRKCPHRSAWIAGSNRQ